MGVTITSSQGGDWELEKRDVTCPKLHGNVVTQIQLHVDDFPVLLSTATHFLFLLPEAPPPFFF